jgi:aryl sulfotransferase
VSSRVWLASYPKSGNTWLRTLIGCLSLKDGETFDINHTLERAGIASAREPFDNVTLIDSGLLTQDEIDRLRPRVYEEWALRLEEKARDELSGTPTVRFAKVHDAYTLTSLGEPLLGGARGAEGAIVIVRDPRDVAPSLANHRRSTIDEAIDFMNDMCAAFSRRTDRQNSQFRQFLLSWSGHVASWLDQHDIPVHLIRYEDLKCDTAGTMAAAMRFAGLSVASRDVARAVRLAAFDNLQAQEREHGFAEWQDRGGQGRLFFRRGETGAWRDELTAEQVARIESAHGSIMTRLGYEISAAANAAGIPAVIRPARSLG